MSAVSTLPLYTFDGLSDEAREKAREWYRSFDVVDDWYECVYDDFEAVCAILGIELDTRTVPLYGGGTRQKPCIWFRGFCSQGDGACFQGLYRYQKAASRKIREYAPQDSELHAIADALQSIQRRNFYQLAATISHRGFYYHEYCMRISVECDSSGYREMTADAEEAVAEALRDLARWIYRRLEQEYDYQMSNAVVDEMLTINEYTFTDTGQPIG